MTKTCPRCGRQFECLHEEMMLAYKEGRPLPVCHCTTVTLSPAQRDRLALRYPNQCLCHECLTQLSD